MEHCLEFELCELILEPLLVQAKAVALLGGLGERELREGSVAACEGTRSHPSEQNARSPWS